MILKYGGYLKTRSETMSSTLSLSQPRRRATALGSTASTHQQWRGLCLNLTPVTPGTGLQPYLSYSSLCALGAKNATGQRVSYAV